MALALIPDVRVPPSPVLPWVACLLIWFRVAVAQASACWPAMTSSGFITVARLQLCEALKGQYELPRQRKDGKMGESINGVSGSPMAI